MKHKSKAKRDRRAAAKAMGHASDVTATPPSDAAAASVGSGSLSAAPCAFPVLPSDRDERNVSNQLVNDSRSPWALSVEDTSPRHISYSHLTFVEPQSQHLVAIDKTIEGPLLPAILPPLVVADVVGAPTMSTYTAIHSPSTSHQAVHVPTTSSASGQSPLHSPYASSSRYCSPCADAISISYSIQCVLGEYFDCCHQVAA